MFLVRTSLVLFSLIPAVCLLEMIVRFWAEPPPGIALHVIDEEEPYLFRPNPEHAEISPQGLRDSVYAIPKPAGVFRILFLGDSVTYGLFVEKEDTFPERLERGLKGKYSWIEVLNGGVNGYTPYNQLHYYKKRLRAFQPDLVITGFCMNDIADPDLHWNNGQRYFERIPAGAFPNPESCRKEIPGNRNWGIQLGSYLERKSAFYRFLGQHWELYADAPRRYESVNGFRWPVYIADEPSPTIKALLDINSAEWRWLKGIYAELKESVSADKANLMFVIFPLAYQVSVQYPYLPQGPFSEYCKENGLPCLDLLPSFRKHGGKKLFMGKHRYHPRDIWHLSPKGHEVAAAAIEDFLEEKGLLAVRSGKRTQDSVYSTQRIETVA